MEHGWPHRPRVSRETRLLLITAMIAVAALWALARIRFPDRPAGPNPVQPILTQLAPRPTFDDLAGEISQLQPRIQRLLVTFPPTPFSGAAASTGARGPWPALRVRQDVALVLLDDAAEAGDGIREDLIALDPASRLALVRVHGPSAPPLVSWEPQETQQPRFLIAGDVSTADVSLRPVFVGTLAPTESPVWPDRIWLVPAGAGLVPGSFLFTSDARLAGLVIDHGGGTAIVPGAVVLAEAERLLVPNLTTPGHVGIDVQSLTAPVASATGAASGVVVTWVDGTGPAAGRLAPGDVLEAVNGNTLPTPLHWNARAARLSAGEAITVRVRRGGVVRDVAVIAAPHRTAPASPSLGLTLRGIAGAGAEVVRVDPGSIAEMAGILAGDIITRVAESDAPSPGDIRRSFAAAAQGRALLVALTRGDIHLVTALEK